MAWTTLGTVAPGNVLRANSGTAAYNNVIGNLYMGQPTFTNEAARNAAITSPDEGMAAYLTASTVATATGGSTAIPTGVQTIYNGSVWVCVTPVGAFTNDTGTRATNSYGTLTGGGTNPSATLVTGTTALVHFSASMFNSLASNTFVSVAVSGDTTSAANDDRSISFTTTAGIGTGRTVLLTGLTAGTNTFTLNYKAETGTGSFLRRHIIVQGIA